MLRTEAPNLAVLSQNVPEPKLLNLACGDVTHPAWTNVEFFPHSLRYRAPLVGRAYRRLRSHARIGGADVLLADLRHGIPFGDASYDAVYHSNFLEHLHRSDARRFLAECLRVLRPGGSIRVVVPDLETRARAYLDALRSVQRDEAGAEDRYRWAVIDLFDQMARRELGGEMQSWIDAGWFEYETAPAESVERAQRTPGWRARVSEAVVGRPTPDSTGELHRWWYDSYSLKAELERAGFVTPVTRRPLESAIPGWERYALDVRPDGTPRSPNCVYVEASRPGSAAGSASLDADLHEIAPTESRSAH